MDLYIIRLKGNISFTEHLVGGYLLLGVILSGKLTIQINGDRHPIHKGQCLLIEIPHSLALKISGNVQLAYILLGDLDFLKPYLISCPLLLLYNFKDRAVIIPLKRRQKLPTMGLLGYLWYRWNANSTQKGKYSGQLSLALRLLVSELHESLSPKPYKKVPRHEQLFIDFLMELKVNKGKERLIGFYASKLCISTGYLSKVIKKASGCPPRYFIVATAVFESKGLLYSNKPIKEVATMMGFKSVHHFSTFFSRYTGMSPSVFVKAHDNDGR